MLARLKAAEPDFDRLLTIPEKPASIAAAEQAYQDAVAARQEGQQRHVEAGRRLAAQQLGQPPQISSADVEAIGRELAPLFEAEAVAKAKRDEENQAYQASLGSALEEPLRLYREAVDQALGRLENLLTYGPSFREKTKQAGIDINRFSTLPGVCPQLWERLNYVRVAFDRTN
ncbi:hypothetical protein EN852_009740 [Mesorhizobium sp. M2E.F.Ca.ET.209.01.1.1]|uniref:hypothetical protein n=1 Tax=Mesorhizobium sp. M2E.F.Ca.ET.209.01.1.1 TaxID=2500526 RepID=UPI000FDBBCE9|nr:hypothetical protein [Mesorhizobium sp. M2E.F.Ca.ET.209.01.1.1]TGS15905.1 hypothetical protein EN852_009740 [Mesorhizobium sp. M2E.F.Ca.ET.209.01.1.1]